MKTSLEAKIAELESEIKESSKVKQVKAFDAKTYRTASQQPQINLEPASKPTGLIEKIKIG